MKWCLCARINFFSITISVAKRSNRRRAYRTLVIAQCWEWEREIEREWKREDRKVYRCECKQKENRKQNLRHSCNRCKWPLGILWMSTATSSAVETIFSCALSLRFCTCVIRRNLTYTAMTRSTTQNLHARDNKDDESASCAKRAVATELWAGTTTCWSKDKIHTHPTYTNTKKVYFAVE